MSLKKYLKYSLFILPIILIIYLGRKQNNNKINSTSADQLVPILPSHSHDYAYKRAYLNPFDKTNETCRANINKHKCTGSCRSYHYNFPSCVYKQPKSIDLQGEDNKESHIEKVIKSMDYY